MRVIDLFCGAGGFSEGFRQAGFEIYWAIDKEFLPISSFRLNHEDTIGVQGDVMELLTVPDCDILIGSPPCPHFSGANRNFHGEPDLTLVNKFLELVEHVKPKYWIMENVVGIKEYLPRHKRYQILHANRFGLRHKRERIFYGNFPKVKSTKIRAIKYPTPIATDDHLHKSNNNPQLGCLSDYFGFTPDLDVFKRVMGFPDNYIFVGKKKDQIKQIGNAVCPPVSRAIAESILKTENDH